MSRSRPIITSQNPKSPVSEAYRTLRTSIEFSRVDGELKSIMITSATPGEGKSTTAANLAAVYAQADKRVLIIDADLRKPTLHYAFNLSNRIGLTSYLAGQSKLEYCITVSEENQVDVLPSGPLPPNPAEMLSSKRMKNMLEELRAQYDILLIDTPPVLAVTDAQIVATLCDGVLLVVNSGKVKREQAAKAQASLNHVKARILGVVLNSVERSSSDSHYYYYYGRQGEG